MAFCLSAHLDEFCYQIVQYAVLTDVDRRDSVDKTAEQLDVDSARDIVKQVSAVGIQAFRVKAKALGVRLYQLLKHNSHSPAFIIGNDHPLVDVARAHTIELSVLKHLAPRFVQGDLQAGLLFFVRAHIL